MKPTISNTIITPISGLIEWIVINEGTVLHTNNMMYGKIQDVRWRYFLDPDDPKETYACVETNGSFGKVIACFTLEMFIKQLNDEIAWRSTDE